MCFPIAAAIGPLVGAMSTIGSAVMGYANAREQYSQESERYAQNVANAEGDARTSYERLNAQEMENNEQYTEKAQLTLIEGAQKQSSVVAASATSGVSGNVVTALIDEIGTAVGMKGAELTKQWQANAQQAEGQKMTTTEQEYSRIESVAQPIAPNPGGAIVGALGGGLKFAGGLFKDTGNSFFGNSPDAGSSVNVTPSGGGDSTVPLGHGGIGMM